MQITRQADYALRAMLFLARMDPTSGQPPAMIAEMQHIPPSFLAKIISQLSIAGLIHTSRGGARRRSALPVQRTDFGAGSGGSD